MSFLPSSSQSSTVSEPHASQSLALPPSEVASASSPSPCRSARRPRGQTTLEDILSGHMSQPYSFKDFERFLTDKELTVENLQFVGSVRLYLRRFRALPSEVKSGVIPPPTMQGDSWAEVESVRKAWEKSRGLQSGSNESPSGSEHDRGRRTSVAKSRQGSFAKSLSVHDPTPAAAPRGSDPSADQLEPMRRETRRIASTFIRTGASKELNLEDGLRERVLRNLAQTVHPDVFLPAYEEAYAALETGSLGHFLKVAAEHTPPRKLFWLSLGIVELSLSVVIFLLTVLLLPDRPFGWRLVRLVSALFASTGSTTTYAVARGHIRHLTRGKTAMLEPWKLEDADDSSERDDLASPLKGCCTGGPSPSRSSSSAKGLIHPISTTIDQPLSRKTSLSSSSTTGAPILPGDEVKPWPFSLWGNSPAPYRTWKRGHLPPPMAAVLDAAGDLLSSAGRPHEYAYQPAPSTDVSATQACSATPAAASLERDDSPGPVRTWKRGHVPPSKSLRVDIGTPTVHFASLPSPTKSVDRPLPVEDQVFSAAFILDDSPPPVSNWGKRGHLPSTAPPPRFSSRAAIVPDWDVSFRSTEPAAATAPRSQHVRRVSDRSRSSLAGPVSLYTTRRFSHLQRIVAVEVVLVGLVYTACWIALCLAVPSP